MEVPSHLAVSQLRLSNAHFQYLFHVQVWLVLTLPVLLGENVSAKGDSGSPLRTLRKPCNYEQASELLGASTPQLLIKDGYPAETHSVVTQDGYIIDLHRVPAPNRSAVLLMPGILQSSRDFLMNCYGRALPHMLFNAGFDVWLGNYRGNSYGRNHTKLLPNQSAFWQFETKDIMRFDGPALVDYILEKTGQKKLTWVGFSLGNTVLFGMLSVRPDYNEKILGAVAMGNAVYFSKGSNRLLKYAARNKNTVEAFVSKFWHGEIIPSRIARILSTIVPEACIAEAKSSSYGICSWVFRQIGLYNPYQINEPYLPQIVSDFPSPTGYKVIGQWFQWINSGEFSSYDRERHSWAEAPLRAKYLPKFNLSQTRIPVLNFWSETDYITSKEDVLRAVSELPNVVANLEVKYPRWGHIDYIYGKDADLYIYSHVLDFLSQLTR